MPFLCAYMIYLVSCILSSSAIYVIFKLAKNYQCKLSSVITYNYLAATLLGVSFFQPFHAVDIQNSLSWLPFGIILGILFILMFYLIGISSQKAGITVTTLANKLSLVFPVLFSLLYFNEEISTIKYMGLSTAVIAVLLTVYNRDVKNTRLIYVILPIAIFIGSGLVDSIVKYVQALKITDAEAPLYTTTVFFVAFLCGTIISVVQTKGKPRFHLPSLTLGIILGGANFGSLYFIIKALNNSKLDSSLIFALNNMSVVALTALLGTFIFNEKLNRINIVGIVLAIISLYFLL